MLAVKKLTVVLAGLIISSLVNSEGNLVEGAFGIKFGEVLGHPSTSAVPKLVEWINGAERGGCKEKQSADSTGLPKITLECPISPRKEHYLFDSYLVQITRGTHRVYSVVGSGRTTADHAGCVDQANIVMGALNEKYGIEFSRWSHEYPSGNEMTKWAAIECEGRWIKEDQAQWYCSKRLELSGNVLWTVPQKIALECLTNLAAGNFAKTLEGLGSRGLVTESLKSAVDNPTSLTIHYANYRVLEKEIEVLKSDNSGL